MTGAAKHQAVAPWFGARDLPRSCLLHKRAPDLGDGFALLQRACEREFGFPGADVVRGAPLLLIRIPKTASVSLALQVYGQMVHVPHRGAAFYREAEPGFFARATSFAVVRESSKRAASAYRWLRGDGNKLAAPVRRGREEVAGADNVEHCVLDILEPAAVGGRLRHLDPVLYRQCDCVCDVAGHVIVDHLFRMEHMGEVQALLVANGVSRSEIRVDKAEHAGSRVREASRAEAGTFESVYYADAALSGNGPPGFRP